MFIVVIPIFLALCVLFAYLYAYVPFGVLSLSKRLSVRISFFIFYAIFTLLIAFARLDIVVIMPYTIAIVILSILILKRKGYFTNFTKARVAMAGACLLVFTWLLEVPQTIIVNLLPVKLEIVNDDFEYVENPEQNFGRKHNIYFEYEKEKKFLNFAYTKNNIYVCDSFDCKGDKKYIGYVWTPWSDAGPLCIDASGRCNRYIKRYSGGRDYLMSFIKNKNNNK
ncbi:MAG: hypothetical protein MR964_02195 [Campylobacter sp.]|uniref:hypothetical protein n=1 Tax=Campylobacter sp. TaxID=205 RepID=UPI002AA6E748|nr:hypothetical protein [Campylobacter sp.]MCI7023035.1 hypothetical protein [Campylobacter sp.]